MLVRKSVFFSLSALSLIASSPRSYAEQIDYYDNDSKRSFRLASSEKMTYWHAVDTCMRMEGGWRLVGCEEDEVPVGLKHRIMTLSLGQHIPMNEAGERTLWCARDDMGSILGRAFFMDGGNWTLDGNNNIGSRDFDKDQAASYAVCEKKPGVDPRPTRLTPWLCIRGIEFRGYRRSDGGHTQNIGVNIIGWGSEEEEAYDAYRRDISMVNNHLNASVYTRYEPQNTSVYPFCEMVGLP